MGPFQGMSEMATMAEAPIMAVTSGEQSRSRLMTVQVMHTSLRRSLGNRGAWAGR